MHAVIQLVQAGLHALKLGRRLVDFGFHCIWGVYELRKVLLGRLRVIEFYFQEEFGAQEGVTCVFVRVRQNFGVGDAFSVKL